MQDILELMALNPQGLNLKTIARATDLILEVRKPTLLGYLKDLEFAGKIKLNAKGKWVLKK